MGGFERGNTSSAIAVFLKCLQPAIRGLASFCRQLNERDVFKRSTLGLRIELFCLDETYDELLTVPRKITEYGDSVMIPTMSLH